MKTKLLLASFCLHFCFIHFANAQIHTIDLADDLLKIPGFGYRIKQVIDDRPDTTNIGFIVKGNLDSKYLVDLENGFNNNLSALLSRSFNSSSDHSGLIIKVNRFFVYNFLDENGYYNVAEINLDFFVQDETGWYHEFQSGGCELNRGNNSNRQYKKLLHKVLQTSFEEFSGRMKQKLGYHVKVSENEMYLVDPENFFSRQTEIADRRNGIYHTFNDFRDNITDIKTSFSTKEKGPSDLDKPFLKLKDIPYVEIERIWGICKNETVYINVSGLFVPTEFHGGSLLIPAMPAAMDGADAAVVGVSALYFGLIGGMIAAAIVIPLDGSANLEKQDFFVDPATGMPMPENIPDYRTTGSEILFYTDKFKPEDKRVDLFIDDVFQCSLMPKSYAVVKGLTPGKETEIRLECDGSEYSEKLLLDKADTYYIEVELKKRDQLSLFHKRSESSISYIDGDIEKGKLTEIVPKK